MDRQIDGLFYLETNITIWLVVLHIKPGLDNLSTANTRETVLQSHKELLCQLRSHKQLDLSKSKKQNIFLFNSKPMIFYSMSSDMYATIAIFRSAANI